MKRQWYVKKTMRGVVICWVLLSPPPLTVSDAIVLHTIYSHPNDIYSPDFPFIKSGNIWTHAVNLIHVEEKERIIIQKSSCLQGQTIVQKGI